MILDCKCCNVSMKVVGQPWWNNGSYINDDSCFHGYYISPFPFLPLELQEEQAPVHTASEGKGKRKWVLDDEDGTDRAIDGSTSTHYQNDFV